MKLTIIKEELINVLKFMAKFTAKTYQHPVLTKVNVVNEDGQVYFYATNAYRAVKYHIEKCTFSKLTSFKIDPTHILTLLSLYSTRLYEDVTIHTETAENVYFIDIGDMKNIPLPSVGNDNYPNISKFFEFDIEKEEPALMFETQELLNAVIAFNKAGCDRVKFVRYSNNRNILMQGDNNKNIETIIVTTKF